MGGLDAGWWWAIAGLLLLIAEMVAPGFFLIFIGAAAIATGLFTLLFDLGVAPQLILFVVYTAVAVLVGKRWYAQPNPGDQEHNLNDPARRIVGRVVTVVEEIDSSSGRVRLGDSEWSARGGPAAVGEKVTITAVDGNCLTVEAVRTLPPA
jgi:membrane protein implicated in regulation of membrane protease activity